MNFQARLDHRLKMSGRRQGRGKREIPEKTLRPAASSGTIPTFESPGATPLGIEPGLGSPGWEESSLTTAPPRQPFALINGAAQGSVIQSTAGPIVAFRKIADNQCAVDIGIFVHKTVEYSLQDKTEVNPMYTDVTFPIGSQFIRYALDYSEPVVDLRRHQPRLYSRLTYSSAQVTCSSATAAGTTYSIHSTQPRGTNERMKQVEAKLACAPSTLALSYCAKSQAGTNAAIFHDHFSFDNTFAQIHFHDWTI
ncbi:hypothetical protein PR048_031171 [Dryococelus australis]|uniref:Uncharacterized protein n=1 Tax=Dryococelus australis TaxID=614101 RepID=A0ABQ9G4I5_9NEOP|nr:hypothetical protein PR048_031171 [Dryococelus australis]